MDEVRARKRRPVSDDDLENQPDSEVKKAPPSRWSTKMKVFLGIIVFLMIFILYIVAAPSPIDSRPVHYPDTLPYFDGVMNPNTKLQQAEKILEGQLNGPESLVMDATGNNLYTGLADGRIVRITKTGEMETVTRTGEDLPTCGTYNAEPRCGRPLGMRFNRQGNRLIVCDAYKGLLSVDVTTGNIETLIAAEDGMEGHPFKFLNDLAIGSDETIYFTDSSWKWNRRDVRYLVIEGGGHGRIMFYNPNTKEQGVLLSGLYFPNGIELSPDENHLVICETTIARIIRFHLGGDHKGVYDLFNDNLPGLPDNIRRHSSGGYWVGLAGARKWPFSMLDSLAPYPTLRTILTKIFSQETLAKLVPKYGLMLHVDSYGDILSSYHDPSGEIISSVSEILEDTKNNVLYLGSYHAQFLAKLKL